VGELPLKVAREAVDEVVGVSEDEIVNAMRLLMTRTKLYVEGSGASATAALLAGKVKAPRGAKVASIISGGNVDLESICAKVVGAQR
ncbi:MAG: pyridoxal-phosphate dependent enzyme, partial [Planctomycetaceae bacterium]|nr:pyridoxal-phosphate dependent enzyme [Planctomycetaceae bacterium]